MNRMVYKLQPYIIVNNCNKLDGDFGTPEQRIEAEKRAWESCMTMNGSWGYQQTDDDWKPLKTEVRNPISCACDGGNYLLNIGPTADGSIPQESGQILVRFLNLPANAPDNPVTAIALECESEPKQDNEFVSGASGIVCRSDRT